VSTDVGRSAAEAPTVGKEPDVAPPNAGIAEETAPAQPTADVEVQASPITTEAEAAAEVKGEAPGEVVAPEAGTESTESTESTEGTES
jgi:hypothetical protein